MTENFFQGYDVDTDKLASKLRELADEIEEDDTALQKLRSDKRVNMDEPLAVTLELQYLTNNQNLIDFIDVIGR